MKNYQCYLTSYSPYKINDVDEFQYVLSLRHKKGKIIEPKKLYNPCNPKNYINFNPLLRYHNKNTVPIDQPYPKHDFIKELYNPYYRNYRTLKNIYERWKTENKDYHEHSILISL